MADDIDPDTFDPDAFDAAAFAPPPHDGGLAQAEALAAEVRKGAASMVAVAGRIESTLIAFEERATARDKAIMQRVVDPDDLKRGAALGAIEGGQQLARTTTDSIGKLVEPLRSQIERDGQQRQQWAKDMTERTDRLHNAAWKVGQHWEARRNRWQELAVALALGLLLGAGSIFWLNRLASQEAYQNGVNANARYYLENPDEFKKAKAEYDRNRAKAR